MVLKTRDMLLETVVRDMTYSVSIVSESDGVYIAGQTHSSHVKGFQHFAPQRVIQTYISVVSARTE